MPVARYEIVLDLDNDRRITDAVLYGQADFGEDHQSYFVTSFSQGPFSTNLEASQRLVADLVRDVVRRR